METRILKRGTLELPCKLTSEEFRQRARDLAEAHEDRKGLDGKHEMVKRQMKSEIASADARIDLLAVQVSRGEEMRQVEFEDVADMKKLVVVRVRKDTGEVLNERVMSDLERQEKMPLTS